LKSVIAVVWLRCFLANDFVKKWIKKAARINRLLTTHAREWKVVVATLLGSHS
jgi:hypothetical protein